MIYQAQNGAWRRDYCYEEHSLIEPGKFSNRLSATVLHPNGNQPLEETYTHDAHGNMTKMPHLSLMRWDYQDQLQATAQQIVNNGGTPEITYYVYDAGGQRTRKVTERQATAGQTPTRKKERIYVGAFEIYREYQKDGETVELERETLHIMDDEQRIAWWRLARRATTARRRSSSAISSVTISGRPVWSWMTPGRSFPTRSITPTAARCIRRGGVRRRWA
jgi:hypothetical protein